MRIRFDRSRVDSDYALWLTGLSRVEGRNLCAYQLDIHYHLIPDDGGVYPEINQAIIRPRVGPCSELRDRVVRRVCNIIPDGPGDPVDPFPDAIRTGLGSRLPIVDLDGFDPSIEQAAAQQGGCCGQPAP